MNPLPWLVRRFPRLFGLEWAEMEWPMPTAEERTWDLRPVRFLSSKEWEVMGE